MTMTYPLFFHKLKSIIGYSIAIVVIVTALGVSGLRFLLTTANLYHDEVEQFASKLLEQPVKIGTMDAKLSGLVPTVIFHKVQLLSKKKQKPLFILSRIDVGISFRELLFRQEIIPEYITVRGANLNVTRTVKNEIRVEGINVSSLKAATEKSNNKQVNSLIEKWLLSRSEITIEDSKIVWRDEKKGSLKWAFDNVNFILKNNALHHQLSLHGTLPQILGGKIKLDIDIEGDITKPFLWQAKLYAESESVNLKSLQTYIDKKTLKINNGTSAVKLWMDVDNGKISNLSGNINLDNIAYQYKQKKEARVNHVSAIFDAEQSEKEVWNVSVDRFFYKNNTRVWPDSKFNFAFDYLNNQIGDFYIKADYLKLGILSQIANDHNLMEEENITRLHSLNVQGDVHDFLILWHDKKLHKIKAKFKNFSANGWKKIPAVKNMSGQFFYENDHGRISIASSQSSLYFSELFRHELIFNALSANINFLNTDEGLLFELEKINAENDDASLTSRGSLWLPKNNSSPYLELYAFAEKGNAASVSRYLPVAIMSKPLVSWLDKGIVAGKVNNATVIFNGKLSDFPFKNNEGSFIVDFDASDVIVDYQKHWPKIEGASITARFTGQGMQIHLSKAKISKLAMNDSKAEIRSFSQAELALKFSVKGSLSDSASFLVNSPVVPKAKEFVSSVKLAGTTDSSVKINIPLSAELRKNKKIIYSGYSILKKASVSMLDEKIDITDINGKVFFNEKGISAKKIPAKLLQKKVDFKITTTKKEKNIKVLAKGIMEPGLLLSKFNIPGADNISGATEYSADITFPAKNAAIPYPVLTMQSQLSDIESTFPEFLAKGKKEKNTVVFNAKFKSKKTTQFDLIFKKGSALVEVVKTRTGNAILNRGAISFSENTATLPHNKVLYIDGSIKQFTPSKWLDALGLNKKYNAPAFFVNPVVLNLTELALMTKDKNNSNNTSTIAPQKLPRFEGIINQLSLNQEFLGRLDFKTSKRSYGMHLDEFILSAKNMKLVAQGDWRQNSGNPRTNIELTVSSKDFGSMLTDLGFSAIIKDGQAQAVSRLNWAGSPADFQLNTLNGSIQLNLENGNIVDVDPSSGRLLGFFSLSALPRKLFGDFKSAVGDGFSFDKAKGQILIRSGHAYTDGFVITSPIADVSVSGRTGLAERDYDNTVVVVPAVGDGVTGLVALLVNLPAGVGLWLMDKLTGEQFNEASTRIYEITGSWAKPKIKLIANP